MQRRTLQIALLGILIAALLMSACVSAILVYNDHQRFVAACLEIRQSQSNPVALTESARAAETSRCLRDIASTVASTVGTAFGPLLVIMLSVIFMHGPVQDDFLDRLRSRIALLIFGLLQLIAVVILTWSVVLTPNLLDLRPDAFQNAIFTAVQGIIVAFVFPRSGDASEQRSGDSTRPRGTL
jgi:hypothetical protein